MAKVLMPMAQGFEEIEALTVVDILRRAEIEAFWPDFFPVRFAGAHKVSIVPDTTIDAVNAAAFDMIILPGGQPGTDNLNADPRIHKILTGFASGDKLIGAICAASIVLASTGLLHGAKSDLFPFIY